MKNNTRLLILTGLSATLTVIFYYMSYAFNPKFYNLSNPLYVRDYRAAGGTIIILMILLLVIIFSSIFITHVLKDTKQLEIFDQSGTPEYYKKENHFSLIRLFQYYTLFTTLWLLIRDSYRSYTLFDSMRAIYIFQTDLLFVMWDVSFLLFLVFTLTLGFEYYQSKKAISE